MQPFTITIADDDLEDLELLTDLFRHNEKFILMGSLSSGIEVFDEISRKKNVPDILLIDMYMPHFTGIDTVQALDTLKAAPTMIKFVISTSDNAEKDNHINNPYIVFLRKPTSMAEIRALPNVILETVMQRNRLAM